jgi:hypothetical protein
LLAPKLGEQIEETRVGVGRRRPLHVLHRGSVRGEVKGKQLQTDIDHSRCGVEERCGFLVGMLIEMLAKILLRVLAPLVGEVVGGVWATF